MSICVEPFHGRKNIDFDIAPAAGSALQLEGAIWGLRTVDEAKDSFHRSLAGG
jgi:hypothetical protein